MNYQKLTNRQMVELSMRADTLADDLSFEASRLRDTEFDEKLTVWDYEEADKALALMEKHLENFRKKRLQMDEACQWLQEED